MLLYKCIVTLIAIALCCAFVLPEMLKFWNSEQVQTLLENGKEFVKCFVSLNRAGMESAKEAILGSNGSFQQVEKLLSSMTLEIVLTIVGFVFVYILKRFVDTLCHFTVGSLLNDKMSTYAEMPFATSIISNLGKASVYSLVYVPVVFAFDIIIAVLCWFMLSILPVFLGIFCSISLIVICQAFKLTFTAYWMPALTNGASLKEAMRSQGKEAKTQRVKVFGVYFASVYFVIIVNVVATICTFGSALIITLPASYFFFICQQYVCYYTIKGKKYFITYDKIAANPDKGDSEHFFDYISTETETVEIITAEEDKTNEVEVESSENA